jgi:hypothetical protein
MIDDSNPCKHGDSNFDSEVAGDSHEPRGQPGLGYLRNKQLASGWQLPF